MTTQRPATLTVAAILLVLLSLINLAVPLLATAGSPPLPIVIASVVLGVAGLIATGGLWARRTWAAWVTVIISAINAITSLPGFAMAPTPALFIGAVVGAVGAALVIVLVLLPASRHAYA